MVKPVIYTVILIRNVTWGLRICKKTIYLTTDYWRFWNSNRGITMRDKTPKNMKQNISLPQIAHQSVTDLITQIDHKDIF
jgi:hypothetical protein